MCLYIIDVLLHCLGMSWELHRPFLQRSETLSTLLETAEDPAPKKYYKSKLSEDLDNFVNKSGLYSNEYQVLYSQTVIPAGMVQT